MGLADNIILFRTPSVIKTVLFGSDVAGWATVAAGFMANQGLFVLGLYWFGERYYILVWLVVTTIITVMTFGLGKLWAFKP